MILRMIIFLTMFRRFTIVILMSIIMLSLVLLFLILL